MKPGSKVTLKDEYKDSNDFEYCMKPEYGKVYTVRSLGQSAYIIGFNYVSVEELDGIYAIFMWREVDDLSNYTVDSLIEELTEVKELELV